MGVYDVSGDKLPLTTESGSTVQSGGAFSFQGSGDQLSFSRTPNFPKNLASEGSRQLSGDEVSLGNERQTVFISPEVKLSQRAEASKKGY